MTSLPVKFDWKECIFTQNLNKKVKFWKKMEFWQNFNLLRIFPKNKLLPVNIELWWRHFRLNLTEKGDFRSNLTPKSVFSLKIWKKMEFWQNFNLLRIFPKNKLLPVNIELWWRHFRLNLTEKGDFRSNLTPKSVFSLKIGIKLSNFEKNGILAKFQFVANFP